jgi:hypothetical protein
MTTLNPVVRLKSWTVGKHKDRYHISCDDHPKAWGRSYKSLRHATLAIARHLEREFVEGATRFGGST